MHLPLLFDVVFTQVHCLPTDYDDNYCRHNIVGIVLSMSLDSILVPSVVGVSVPFTELHAHAYLYCSCFGTLFTNKLWELCCEIFNILLLLTLGAHAQRGLQYSFCHSVLVHCLPTNYGNHVVRFYYCTKYCLYQSFH